MNKKRLIIISFILVCIVGVVYFCHPHNYKETVVSEASCIEEGEFHYSCWCGSAYEEHPAPLGHNYTSEVTEEATCTENGTMTYVCSRCNDTYTEEIAATGHNFVEQESAKPGCISKVCMNCKEVVEEKDTAFWENLITMYVQDTCDIYATPSTDAPILGQFARGDEVEVSVIEDSWATVVLDDGIGYVRADLLGNSKPAAESAPAANSASTGESAPSTETAPVEESDPSVGKTEAGAAGLSAEQQAFLDSIGAGTMQEQTGEMHEAQVDNETSVDISGVTLH